MSPSDGFDCISGSALRHPRILNEVEMLMATRTTSNQQSEATKTAVDTAKEAAEAATERAAIFEQDVSLTADNMLETVVSGQAGAVHAVESTGHAVLEGMARVQKEVVDFVSTRIRQDMETQKELLRCRNFDELREVQTRFLKTAMDQYAAESKRLMQLGSEVFARSANR
jgi:hypothetical protein